MIRHAIASALYGLAARIDQPGRCDISGDGMDFGDFKWAGWEDGFESGHFQIHTQPGTPIGANFKPGRLTYAALHIGRGAHVTVFLNRTTARRLLRVVGEVDAAYAKYGEDRP